MTEEDETCLASETVVVQPKYFRRSYQFGNFEEVKNYGAQTEELITDETRKMAEELDLVIQEVRVQWRVEVDFRCYPYPEELTSDLDKDDEMYEEDVERRRASYREGVLSSMDASTGSPLALSILHAEEPATEAAGPS